MVSRGEPSASPKNYGANVRVSVGAVTITDGRTYVTSVRRSKKAILKT